MLVPSAHEVPAHSDSKPVQLVLILSMPKHPPRPGLPSASKMLRPYIALSLTGVSVRTGVDGEHVPPALQRFPEVLALDVDRQLKGNIETLQTQWFVRGLALKKLLRSQPQVQSPSTVHGRHLDACACVPISPTAVCGDKLLRPVRRCWDTTSTAEATARVTATAAGRGYEARCQHGLPCTQQCNTECGQGRFQNMHLVESVFVSESSSGLTYEPLYSEYDAAAS